MSIEAHNREIDEIVRVLQKTRSILFITGAGVSADSGMPTYRGIGGLYDVDVTEEGFPIEQVLSGTMIRTIPRLTWKYLCQIGDAVRGVTFNRAHSVIAEIERHFPRVWTLTQNVDGFHTLAGAENVIEIHGNIQTLSCMRCHLRVIAEDVSFEQLPPLCRKCDAVLRPNVVLFGESLPETALRRFRREIDRGFGAVFCIGTSGAFPYIREPFLTARRTGIPTVEINPDETVLSPYAHYRLPMGAAIAMDEIWKRFLQSSLIPQ